MASNRRLLTPPDTEVRGGTVSRRMFNDRFSNGSNSDDEFIPPSGKVKMSESPVPDKSGESGANSVQWREAGYEADRHTAEPAIHWSLGRPVQQQHRAQEHDYERLSARKPVERMAQNESGPDKSEKSGAVANQQAAGYDNTDKRHESNKVRDDGHQVRQRILDRLHLEEMERKYSTCEELEMLKSRLAYVETEKAEQIRQDQSRIQDLEYKYIALQGCKKPQM